MNELPLFATGIVSLAFASLSLYLNTIEEEDDGKGTSTILMGM